MTEREQLEQAIATLEAQRLSLGDAIVEVALAPMREKLAALQAFPVTPSIRGEDRRGTGERKLVTVMFADISGFTALSEKMDPEAVRDLMNQCFAHLVPCITQYEGTIDKFIGDEIMALFGAPLAHENDAERAVRAALEMMVTLERFNIQHSTNLGLHFGINTGLVLAGEIGAGVRQDYSVMGDAVNLAARLEDASERGQIFVGPDTYRLTSPLFEFEALAPIRVKGKIEPVPVYRALGLKAKPGKVRGLETKGIASPLVGRDKELATFQGCIQHLLDGQGGIVGVIGEAGLGKSRLVAEVRAWTLEVRNWKLEGNLQPPVANLQFPIWLEGHTLSFGQTISYWPFQEILRAWAGITEDDTEDAAWRKLEQAVQTLFGTETSAYLPYLTSLLALEVRGEYAERVKYLDGDALGKQIFLTSRRFFERLARTRPTILVFEDLHWMDESSAHLLEHLLPLVENVPLLVVGLTRSERDTPAVRLREISTQDYADYYTEIQLMPLSGPNSAQLMRNLLEVEDLPAHLRELIVGKAEGNPFFLEEVIRTLIDTGAVIRDPASRRWRATAQIEAIHIPDTIQGVIMARVDRLDEEVKQVLRVAAIIGRSFLYRVLKAITAASQRLDDSLSELQQTELILEKQAAPELEYIFKHALAQEATYESILLQKRRELHARVAQAIETLFAERLEEFYGLLAYHYAKAEAWDKAQDYLLKAGDQAGRMAADAEALNLYQQALAAYARAFGDKWDPLQRAALERKMGEALFRRGVYPRAVEHFQSALVYLNYRLPMSRWQVRRALLRELIVQAGHRLLPQVVLDSGTAPVGSDVEEEVLIYYYTGIADAFTYSERYLLLVLRMLNLSEQRGYPLGVALGSTTLGAALDLLGFFRLAGWYHRQAIDAAERIQQFFALGSAYCALQFHESLLGQHDQSFEHGRKSAQTFHEAGDLVAWGLPTAFLAWGLVLQGDFAEALAFSKELIRIGQDAGARALWCWGETILGYALRRQGQLQEAIGSQQKALELAEAIPDYVYQITARAELGLCYLRRGDWQAALAELEVCQRIAVEHHVIDPYGRVTMLNNLAETYLFVMEHGDISERSIWLNKAKWACQTARQASSKSQSKVPKAMRLQGTFEWLRSKHSHALNWWRKSLVEAERMGLRYDIGMIHLEMGQRLGEREHLEKAQALFAEIGSELNLARARELLGR